MGMKVPTIVQLAKEALDQGHCVVIGLQTTGEVDISFTLFLRFLLFFSLFLQMYNIWKA